MYRIAVVGMDGTGKSSVINALWEHIGKENCRVQYMGFKNWETALAVAAYEENANNCSRKWSLARRISPIHEMYHRVYKRADERNIVIYDRYVDEQVLFHGIDGGPKSRILSSFYKLFFILLPSPDFTVYLTCDAKVSLARKNDISDIYDFEKKKAALDDYYVSRKHANLIINTGEKPIDEVIDLIIKMVPSGEE